MNERTIKDFDFDYLVKLTESLVSFLKTKPGWVHISDLTADPDTFVKAVIMLGEGRCFDDERGWPQVEFDSSYARIRHVDNKIFYK